MFVCCHRLFVAVALGACWLASAPSLALAEVKLPTLFSDHMVLQRDSTAPIFGAAEPGEEVTVSFRGQQQKATADKQGNWQVNLGKLTAGGPDVLTISGSNEIILQDVLVGEVWIGSGQSNMAGGSGGYAKGDETLAAALAAAPYPQIRLIRGTGGPWQQATEKTANGFSALLFSFGVCLQKELDVPVGLMLGAVGGTPSGRWLTAEMLSADPAVAAATASWSEANPLPERMKHYQTQLAAWEKAAAAAKAEGKNPPRQPVAPVAAGDFSGRGIGSLYKAHISRLAGYGIRGVLWDQGESGTAIAELDQYTTMGALIRGWRTEFRQGEFPFLYVQKYSGGGCAFDESGNPITRNASPFASLPAKVPATQEGLYREHHIKIRQHPATYMVTSSDLGAGIHPTNKFGYGARACRVALGSVYGKKVASYGPTYKSHKIEAGKIRVQFENVGQGLTARHGEGLQGFAISGEDGEFVWAKATIDGDAVIVSSDQVPKPAHVRYAWGRIHPWANLFNEDGLPALTFRTDE